MNDAILERIANALETIADANTLHENRNAIITAVKPFGVFQGDTAVGAFVRITLSFTSQALQRDYDFYKYHPTDEKQTAYGREMIQQIADAIGQPKKFNGPDLIGQRFMVETAGLRIIRIYRPDWMHAFIAKRTGTLIDVQTQEGIAQAHKPVPYLPPAPPQQ